MTHQPTHTPQLVQPFGYQPYPFMFATTTLGRKNPCHPDIHALNHYLNPTISETGILFLINWEKIKIWAGTRTSILCPKASLSKSPINNHLLKRQGCA